MADIHLQRIRGAVTALFAAHIDASDLTDRPLDEREAALATRSLAAYAVKFFSSCEVISAAKAVTDGFDDGGLDSVYFDLESKKLFLCQSKWMKNGHGSPSQADVQKFLAGVRDVVNDRLDHFNARIRAYAAEIRRAILDAEVQIVLVLAYSGADPLGEHAQRALNLFIEEQNGPSDTFSLEILDQGRLYRYVAGGVPGQSVSLDVALASWGTVSEPFQAHYGTVSAQDIARWWKEHGRNLLFRNIRDFKGATEVNDGMRETLLCEPSNFWYFNNGITLLCDRVRKKPIGGSNTAHGIFECAGVSVVNGAQTVGIIGQISEPEQISPEARVHVRLISLEDVPEGFDARITRATNTQNRIEGHDFAALDLNQRRLAAELRLDDLQYAYKTGEPAPDPQRGFTLLDATVALACSQDEPSLAVQVKNQIGRIFDDLSAVPYTLLFNDRTDARQVWRRVQVMREVDAHLKELEDSRFHRAQLIAVHGNRFILHRVFAQFKIKEFVRGVPLRVPVSDIVRPATESAFHELRNYLNADHLDSYLAPLFKNRQKCREIVASLNRRTDQGSNGSGDQTATLFGSE